MSVPKQCLEEFRASVGKILQDAKFLPTDKRFEMLENSIVDNTEMILKNSILIDEIVRVLRGMKEVESE